VEINNNDSFSHLINNFTKKCNLSDSSVIYQTQLLSQLIVSLNY